MPAGPSHTTYLGSIEREAPLLVAAAAANPDAAVPGCPGWTVDRLIAHVGRVYRSVGRHVAQRATEMIPSTEIERPPATGLIEWFLVGLDELMAAFRACDPDEVVWSWSADHTARFSMRRMAHETLVHRWDAESAVGTPDPIDADLAPDGIDELFQAVLPFTIANWDRPVPEEAITLVAADADLSWVLRPVGQTVTAERSAGARSDTATSLSGTAGDLVLALWERVDTDVGSLVVAGNADLVHRWCAISR